MDDPTQGIKLFSEDAVIVHEPDEPVYDDLTEAVSKIYIFLLFRLGMIQNRLIISLTFQRL